MKKDSKKDTMTLKLVEVNYSGEEREILKEEIQLSDSGDFKARIDLEELKVNNPHRCIVNLDGEEFPLDQIKKVKWECRAGDIVDCYGAEINSRKLKGVVRFDGFPSYKDHFGKKYFKLLVDILKEEVIPVMEKKEVLANAQV